MSKTKQRILPVLFTVAVLMSLMLTGCRYDVPEGYTSKHHTYAEAVEYAKNIDPDATVSEDSKDINENYRDYRIWPAVINGKECSVASISVNIYNQGWAAGEFSKRYYRMDTDYDYFVINDVLKEHPDLPHYFVGCGNQYGATYSYAMCYWEEQMWIRTKSISAPEFFHGMQEIIVEDTPVTLFIGEDEQRPLAERVARFLPKVCGNYTIIDTKEFELKGISEEYRGSISHHVMRAVNARVDAYMELFLRHPLSVRRYYRQFDY